MKKTMLLFFIAVSSVLWHCTAPNPGPSISSEPFGTLPDGTEVELFTLTNAGGMQAKITNYGGIITHLFVPDNTGELGDVVLGYDNLDDYVKQNPYFGAIIGRYGNRIAKGKFTLNGEDYTLAINNGENHLHGGLIGFDKVVWSAAASTTDNAAVLELQYSSADMEEGYPGKLDVLVTYSLTNDNELVMNYKAMTDKPTVCNLTNHSYFNLKDGGASSILDHVLQINAVHYTPVDEGLIPLGIFATVEDTPFDFLQPTAIGARIDQDDEQLKLGGGYDHNYVLNEPAWELRLACTVAEESTGRFMEVFTTEPGVQFYSGNFLDGSITGKNGAVYQQRHGFCLETQHFPDSPNQPNFPSVVLEPGDTYNTTTIYKFAVK
jgi:aldose 1-epimerase